MANKYQAMVVDTFSIEVALRDAKDIGEYKRLQAVHLRNSLGLGVEDIALATGFSVSHVKHIHSAFRRDGLPAVISKNKGGRYHAHLTHVQEEAFIAQFIDIANAGHVLEVSKIHCALEEKIAKPLHVQITYRMLHRHGWRKIAPRPKHPSSDLVAQETFKKTGQKSLWQQREKPVR